MISKNNQRKVSMGMIKGKQITTSVPSIRYHASDGELEELYSDDEKLSPVKDIKSKLDHSESFEERRSASMDENLSEGSPPSDTWKMLLDIRGKITKTFEDKISEIKSEKKKKKKRRKAESGSVSDSEKEITPTEESNYEKQDKESSPLLRRRAHSSRFTFHEIETGLKTKVYEEKSIESGIEAVELFEDSENKTKVSSSEPTDVILSKFLNLLFYHLFVLISTLLVLWLAPFSDVIKGICLGLFVSFIYRKAYSQIQEMLSTPLKKKEISVLEIPAAEEHAVLDKFEGWLNELPYNYKPENYHVARTKSVFLKLEGDILQIFETKTRIPKRAVWDEPNHKVKFTKKRIYSLSGSSIELLPFGLIRRRRWSKKYPICITLTKDALSECTFLKNSSDDDVHEIETGNDKIIMEEEGDEEDEGEEEEAETDDDLCQSKEKKDVFEDSKEEMDDVKHKIFIFARTDRQKEDWFRRLSLSEKVGSKRSSISSAKELPLSPNSSPTTLSNETKHSTSSFFFEPEICYMSYMARYTENQTTSTVPSNPSLSSNDGVWINALLGRLIFDMHKCPEMIKSVQNKIQRKLSNIKLPYFMESLHVSELQIGQGAPIIHNSTKPVIDERGLWFDLDISYEGSLTMTIETKLNLMKLKRTGYSNTNSNDLLDLNKSKPAQSPMFCSDLEDSPETSTEDEDNVQSASPSVSRESTQSSGRKFLSMMDKLASSKYFQSATELSYVRRAMEGVSNTEIKLMVSVSSIQGCLSVNIPPPPTDRLWYGFKPVPSISLTAKPAFGEKTFDIVYITQWIETKLMREFEKIVVIPNMDDLLIPLCPNYPYV